MRGSPEAESNVPHLSSVPNQNLGLHSLDLEPGWIQGPSKLPIHFSLSSALLHSRRHPLLGSVGRQPAWPWRIHSLSQHSLTGENVTESSHLVLGYHFHVDSDHLSYLMHLLLSGPLVLTWPAQNICTLCSVLFLPMSRLTSITLPGCPG